MKKTDTQKRSNTENKYIKKLMERSNESSLKVINLAQENLNEQDIEDLAEILRKNNNTIEELDLSYAISDSTQMKILTDALEGNTSLKVIKLPYCQLSTNDIDSLAKALKNNNNIETLDLSHNNLHNANSFFEILKHNPQIENLDLSETRLFIYKKDTEQLYESILGCKNIKKLELASNYITKDSAEYINKILESHKSIKALNLINAQVMDDNVILDGIIKYSLETIEELDLSSSKLTPSLNITKINTIIEQNTSLKKLVLNKVEESTSKSIKQLLNNEHCQLEEIKVSDKMDSTRINNLLHAIPDKSTIKKLTINTTTNSTEFIIKDLVELIKNNKSIEEIKLGGSEGLDRMKNEILEPLIAALKDNNNIKKFDLMDYAIDNTGMQYVVDLLKHNSNITKLDVQVTVASLPTFLEAVNKNNNINSINLTSLYTEDLKQKMNQSSDIQETILLLANHRTPLNINLSANVILLLDNTLIELMKNNENITINYPMSKFDTNQLSLNDQKKLSNIRDLSTENAAKIKQNEEKLKQVFAEKQQRTENAKKMVDTSSKLQSNKDFEKELKTMQESNTQDIKEQIKIFRQNEDKNAGILADDINIQKEILNKRLAEKRKKQNNLTSNLNESKSTKSAVSEIKKQTLENIEKAIRSVQDTQITQEGKKFQQNLFDMKNSDYQTQDYQTQSEELINNHQTHNIDNINLIERDLKNQSFDIQARRVEQMKRRATNKQKTAQNNPNNDEKIAISIMIDGKEIHKSSKNIESFTLTNNELLAYNKGQSVEKINSLKNFLIDSLITDTNNYESRDEKTNNLKEYIDNVFKNEMKQNINNLKQINLNLSSQAFAQFTMEQMQSRDIDNSVPDKTTSIRNKCKELIEITKQENLSDREKVTQIRDAVIEFIKQETNMHQKLIDNFRDVITDYAEKFVYSLEQINKNEEETGYYQQYNSTISDTFASLYDLPTNEELEAFEEFVDFVVSILNTILDKIQNYIFDDVENTQTNTQTHDEIAIHSLINALETERNKELINSLDIELNKIIGKREAENVSKIRDTIKNFFIKNGIGDEKTMSNTQYTKIFDDYAKEISHKQPDDKRLSHFLSMLTAFKDEYTANNKNNTKAAERLNIFINFIDSKIQDIVNSRIHKNETSYISMIMNEKDNKNSINNRSQ